MQCVLDSPVSSHARGETLHAQCKRTDVVPNIRGELGAVFTHSNHHADRLHAFPFLSANQVFRHRQLVVDKFVPASVSLKTLGVFASHNITKIILHMADDVLDHRIVNRSLVPLESEDVIAFGVDDLRGDVLLASSTSLVMGLSTLF